MRESFRWRRSALIGVAALLLLSGCRPSGPEALRRGDAELRAGRTAEAIRFLEQAASLLPADAEVWNRLGMAYHAAGRLPEAEKAYLRALEFNRNLFDVRFNLGELRLEQGAAREAEAEFRTYLNASAENARNPDAWRGVGLALAAQRQHVAAEVAFNNAVRFNPADSAAWNAFGMTRIALRKPREAYEAFQQAVRLDPGLASAHLNLAVTAQQQLNDRRAALQHYRDFLSIQPSAPNADAVRKVVDELEVRLGIVRPEPPSTLVPTNAPTVTSTTSPSPENFSRPPTNRPVVAIPTNPQPPSIAVATSAPAKPKPSVAVAVAKPPGASNSPPANIRTSTPPATVAANPVVPPRPELKPDPYRLPSVPLEVVPVSVDPPPRRADDLADTVRPVPRPVPPLPETRPPDTIYPQPLPERTGVFAGTALSAPLPDDATPFEPEDDPPSGDEPRRGFWRRVNPVGWFRKGDAANRDVETRVESSIPSKVTPLPPPPPTIRQDIPRYSRINPSLPRSGNRTAAEVEFQKGSQAHARGDSAAALNAYQKAIDLDPSHFEAQHNLALAALQTGDLPLSLRSSEIALTIDPASANARYNLAVALQRSRFPLDAAQELARIIEQQPDDPNAHLALASLCAGDLADPERARAHYQRVLTLRPEHPQAANIRRWMDRNPGP
jgi:tetratricopeptide (TPR) repeat protein